MDEIAPGLWHWTAVRESIGKDVTVKADVHLHHEQFDVMAV